jgi:phage internal scaffolding protein
MSVKSNEFRSAYGARKRNSMKFQQPSLTKQSFKSECDVNRIVKQWKSTGLVKTVGQGEFLDLPDEISYHEALNKVIEAQSSFESLPANGRRNFENDPAKFLSHVENATSREDFEKVGLVPPVEVPSEPTPSASVEPNGEVSDNG